MLALASCGARLAGTLVPPSWSSTMWSIWVLSARDSGRNSPVFCSFPPASYHHWRASSPGHLTRWSQSWRSSSVGARFCHSPALMCVPLTSVTACREPPSLAFVVARAWYSSFHGPFSSGRTKAPRSTRTTVGSSWSCRTVSTVRSSPAYVIVKGSQTVAGGGVSPARPRKGVVARCQDQPGGSGRSDSAAARSACRSSAAEAAGRWAPPAARRFGACARPPCWATWASSWAISARPGAVSGS